MAPSKNPENKGFIAIIAMHSAIVLGWQPGTVITRSKTKNKDKVKKKKQSHSLAFPPIPPTYASLIFGPEKKDTSLTAGLVSQPAGLSYVSWSHWLRSVPGFRAWACRTEGQKCPCTASQLWPANLREGPKENGATATFLISWVVFIEI